MKRIYAFLVIFFLSFPSYNSAAVNAASLDDASYKSQGSFQQKEDKFLSGKSGRKPALISPDSAESQSFKNAVTQDLPQKIGSGAVDPSASISDINKQLKNIIQVNDAIKADQAAKIAQLQKIQEQARLHQQILRNLEAPKMAPAIVRPTDVNEILRQEKIRLIREQTSRNTEVLKTLERQRRS